MNDDDRGHWEGEFWVEDKPDYGDDRFLRIMLKIGIPPLVWLGAALLVVLIVMGTVWRTG